MLSIGMSERVLRSKTFVGERVKSRRKLPKGYSIFRLTVSFAYGAGGNVGNPTPRFVYEAYFGDTLIGPSWTEKGAVDLVKIHSEG